VVTCAKAIRPEHKNERVRAILPIFLCNVLKFIQMGMLMKKLEHFGREGIHGQVKRSLIFRRIWEKD
jgi:hypothetical protein